MYSVFLTFVSIAAMIVLTMFPVLIPALITAGHVVIRRTSGPARAANYLPTASRRLVAAAA